MNKEYFMFCKKKKLVKGGNGLMSFFLILRAKMHAYNVEKYFL